MKVAFFCVMSLDGKLTRHNEPDVRSWASPEDTLQLREAIRQSDAMIMGRATYESRHPKPTPNICRIILTRNPNRFQHEAVPGQLEFTADPPDKVINSLKLRGCDSVLILGGSQTFTPFLRQNLIDEIHVTIEPRMFGSGHALTERLDLDIPVRLIQVQQLNHSGTILLSYSVIKS